MTNETKWKAIATVGIWLGVGIAIGFGYSSDNSGIIIYGGLIATIGMWAL